jgi:hypothetical protein
MFGFKKSKSRYVKAKNPESLKRQKAAIRDYYAKEGEKGRFEK